MAAEQVKKEIRTHLQDVKNLRSNPSNIGKTHFKTEKMKLSVEGYKSISSKQEIAFDGLTILSGANSSGKSSFMQPFLILKQTIENHYDSGSLILYGENVKLTDSSQIISKVPGFEKSLLAYQSAQRLALALHHTNTKEDQDYKLTPSQHLAKKTTTPLY